MKITLQKNKMKEYKMKIKLMIWINSYNKITMLVKKIKLLQNPCLGKKNDYLL